MKARLFTWIAVLAILTSLIILEGTWLVRAFVEWPHRATMLRNGEPHLSNPHTNPPSSPPRQAGAPFALTSEVLREMTFRAAEKCLVPPRILFRQVRVESGFRPWVISSSGAIGLLQVKPYHAFWPLDLLDPETNLNVGACLLRLHFERMHSWELALHAYRGGQYRRTTDNATRLYARAILEVTQ